MQSPDHDAGPVEWRRLDTRLWVGRLDGAPIGMIERGRRYTATDAGERVRGTFRTLREAQHALAADARQPSTEPESDEEPQGRLMLLSASTGALLAATMSAVGLVAFV